MSFSFKDIRQAQQAVWPAVQESLARVKASRDLVNSDPKSQTRAALSRARIPWNRAVADETVWAIAKAGLLATPEAAEVVRAAQDWVASWRDQGIIPSTATDDETDVALYNAVQALATTLQIPEDEAGL